MSGKEAECGKGRVREAHAEAQARTEEAVLVELGHEEALLDGEGVDQSVGHERLAVDQEDTGEEERRLHGANGRRMRVAVMVRQAGGLGDILGRVANEPGRRPVSTISGEPGAAPKGATKGRLVPREEG